MKTDLIISVFHSLLCIEMLWVMFMYLETSYLIIHACCFFCAFLIHMLQNFENLRLLLFELTGFSK